MLSKKSLDINFSGRTIFGAGESARIGEITQEIGASRAFVVTDPGVVASGVVDGITTSLEASNPEVSVFDGVTPNPSTADVEAGSAALGVFGLEGAVVVAVGGGSSLDAAKAISLHVANGGAVQDLDYRNEAPVPGLPVIAVPTTSGTGSETNAFGVVTDPSDGRKFYVGDESVRPVASVLDPELTLGLPPGATAATGLDALCHALEATMSENANPYADALARRVVETVFEWLPAAVESGGDLEARSRMLFGAHLAGLAFSSGTGLGLCHAIAHPVGARVGAPHGAALAAVLPQVMEFNLPTSADKLLLCAASLGISSTEKSGEANARAFISATEELIGTVLGAAPRLRDFGIEETLLPTLVKDAMDDSVMSNTPRKPSAGEVEEILISAL